MIKLSNVKLLVIIAGVVVFGVGVVIWLGRKTAPVAPLPSLPAVEITPVVPQLEASRYSLQAPLPGVTKLPVYEFKGDVVANFGSRWSEALGFSGEPQEVEDALEGTLYLWAKEGETLVLSEDASSLSYRIDLSPLTHPTGVFGSFLPSFEAAAEIVERTLTELGATVNFLEYAPGKSKALKVGVEYVNETTPEQADLVEIHFAAKVNGYPVYLESGPEQDPVLAWIGRDGKLLRLEYHPVGTLGEKIADYSIKNQEELLKDLAGGEGTVVSSGLEGGEKIEVVTISKIDLGYLLPQQEATILQPIFILQGQARAASGQTGTVTIYLPAVP